MVEDLKRPFVAGMPDEKTLVVDFGTRKKNPVFELINSESSSVKFEICVSKDEAKFAFYVKKTGEGLLWLLEEPGKCVYLSVYPYSVGSYYIKPVCWQALLLLKILLFSFFHKPQN